MSLTLPSKQNANPNLLFVGFNQDAGCFAIGLQNGFRIFNTDPLKQKEKEDFSNEEGSGVGFIEMLFRTNFLAILGGGNNPRFKPNKSMVWDDIKKKFVLEFEYASDIKCVRLRRDRLVVILESFIKIYNFDAFPDLLHQYETGPNPNGLASLGQSSKPALLAFPGKKPGEVCVCDVLSPDKTAPLAIRAHHNDLAAITLNYQGTLLATASERGTLIRIFDTSDGKLVHELRRGTNQALIYNIAFNIESSMVCVSSNHETIHVFKLLNDHNGNKSKAHALLPKYFNSHVSDIRFDLTGIGKAICAFSATSANTLIVLGGDGSYYKYNISENEAVRETYANFLEFDDDYCE